VRFPKSARMSSGRVSVVHALQHQALALVVRLPLAERLRSHRISYTYYRILIKSPCPLSGVRAHRVKVVAMDGFAGYHSATTEQLPKARKVMDPFHVVHLAADKLTLTRQRIQQDT